jgi:uncharacterized sulfatase
MKKKSVWASVSGLLLLCGFSQASSQVAEDRTLVLLEASAVPVRTVDSGDPPNVLFIIVDDLNLALGAYEQSDIRPQYATAATPNIDRLAAQGVRFEHAFVQTPLCNPSRASLLSGLRPATLEVHDGGTWPRHKVGDELRMFPEHFRDHGYFTARVGKVGHNRFEHAISWDVSAFALSREPAVALHFPGYLPGHDLAEVRDNTWTAGSELGMSRAQVLAPLGRPAGLPLSWRATHESPRMTPDGTTAGRIIQLLAQNRDKPFFIAAGFHKPHQPWVGSAEFFEKHPVDAMQLPLTQAGDRDDIPAPASEIAPDDAAHTEAQRKQAIAAYHAMVSMTDHYVGQLMRALDDLDLSRSTIVVLTSDHGFHLGEHGGMWRKRSQFDESIRVPLIVRLPGGDNAGQTTHGLVELVDLYPTLIDLSGLPDPAHRLEGTSFVPLLEDPERSWKSAAFSESVREGFHGRTLRTQTHRYTEWIPLDGDGPVLTELYDLKSDPLEFNNLADDRQQSALARRLSENLSAGWQQAQP